MKWLYKKIVKLFYSCGWHNWKSYPSEDGMVAIGPHNLEVKIRCCEDCGKAEKHEYSMMDGFSYEPYNESFQIMPKTKAPTVIGSSYKELLAIQDLEERLKEMEKKNKELAESLKKARSVAGYRSIDDA